MADLDIAVTADLTRDHVEQCAIARVGLTDFGSASYIPALDALLASMRDEAQLNAAGIAAQGERIVNALSNRLRRVDLLRRHPEILEETVNVAAVIVGLPRTGSTMLHRLLSASPQLTALRWWESVYPLPLDGDAVDDRADRIEKAKTLVADILGSAAGFEAIHPLDALAYDEELPLIEQSFLSSLPESGMYLPSYGAHLLAADQSYAYEELVQYLKILQWSSPERRGRRWVLKCPHHLSAVRLVLRIFPTAAIVMTHRPIDQLMGSWYSMVASSTGAGTDADFAHAQAEHWTHWWKHGTEELARARAGAEERFVDIDYRALLTEPLEQARRAATAAGLAITPTDITAWQAWLDGNQRDARPTHKYSLEQFGIDRARLDRDFAVYTKAFPMAAPISA